MKHYFAIPMRVGPRHSVLSKATERIIPSRSSAATIATGKRLQNHAASYHSSAQQYYNLHHEWIHNGKVASKSLQNGVAESGTVVFLHGLLGSGKNLRTLAKRLTKETNGNVSALLLDLRGHGMSNSNLDSNLQNQDNSIFNCSMDVVQTLESLNLVGDQSPIGVVGHSFGGRTALSYHHSLLQRKYEEQGQQEMLKRSVQPPQHCWVLDSCPGKAHASVAGVIDAVSSISNVMPIGSKQKLVGMLRDMGISRPIATWMTTNLQKASDGSDGYEWIFDLDVVEGILSDFPKQDMMQQIRDCATHDNATSSVAHRVHKVIAGRNEAWTSDILDELGEIRDQSQGLDESVSADSNTGMANLNLITLDTGHWVHTDDLEGLVRVMVKTFQ